MTEYEQLISKHGETGVQALLENWERHMGIRYGRIISLERRWEIFWRTTESPERTAA